MTILSLRVKVCHQAHNFICRAAENHKVVPGVPASRGKPLRCRDLALNFSQPCMSSTLYTRLKHLEAVPRAPVT